MSHLVHGDVVNGILVGVLVLAKPDGKAIGVVSLKMLQPQQNPFIPSQPGNSLVSASVQVVLAKPDGEFLKMLHRKSILRPCELAGRTPHWWSCWGCQPPPTGP
jgi:hypothetical protein